MSAVAIVDKKITTLLPILTTKQKKAVLNVMETFAQEEDVWQDKNFVKELDRRTMEFESGKAKTLSLEQLEAKARNSYKAKNAK